MGRVAFRTVGNVRSGGSTRDGRTDRRPHPPHPRCRRRTALCSSSCRPPCPSHHSPRQPMKTAMDVGLRRRTPRRGSHPHLAAVIAAPAAARWAPRASTLPNDAPAMAPAARYGPTAWRAAAAGSPFPTGARPRATTTLNGRERTAAARRATHVGRRSRRSRRFAPEARAAARRRGAASGADGSHLRAPPAAC